MRLSDWNSLPPGRASDHVRPCVEIERWSGELVSGRPYADRAALLAKAETVAAGWTRDEVETALAGHPRIGERAPGRSAQEQAGVGAGHRTALDEGNRRYEERFGRIYLVRAAGRSGEELLDLLEARLSNAPAVEDDVVHEQLQEITMLRLADLVT